MNVFDVQCPQCLSENLVEVKTLGSVDTFCVCGECGHSFDPGQLASDALSLVPR